MQNKNIFVPTELPQPALYDIHGATLGLHAVHHEEERVHSELTAAQIENELAVTRQRTDRTLGNSSIALTVAEQEQYEEAELMAQDQQQFERLEAKNVKAQLNKTRNILKDLSERQRGEFNEYMDENGSGFLQAVKAMGDTIETKFDWADWLGENASDEQLMNFLQWHVDALDKQQHSPYGEIIIRETRAVFLEKVQEGVKHGWLSKHALGTAKDVEHVKVLIGDVFDTTFLETGGYYVRGGSTLVIEQGWGDDENRIQNLFLCYENALLHEFSHALIESDEPEETHPLGARWISEALTEYVRLVIKEGQEGAIVERGSTDTGNYLAERELLDDLLKFGKNVIKPAYATRAYSGDQSDKTAFYEQLNESWGPGALEAVSASVAKYTKKFIRAIKALPENSKLSENEIIGKAELQAVKATHKDLLDKPQKIFAAAQKRAEKAKELIAA